VAFDRLAYGGQVIGSMKSWDLSLNFPSRNRASLGEIFRINFARNSK